MPLRLLQLLLDPRSVLELLLIGYSVVVVISAEVSCMFLGYRVYVGGEGESEEVKGQQTILPDISVHCGVN